METRSDKFFRLVERACDAYIVGLAVLTFIVLFNR